MDKQREQEIEQELERYSRAYLKKEYNLSFHSKVKINGRLTRSAGRYLNNCKRPNEVAVDISRRIINTGNKKLIQGVLEHELIHYAMHYLGRPYKDSDNEFQEELKRKNVPSEIQLDKYGITKHTVWMVVCEECKNILKVTERKPRMNLFGARSGCCKSPVGLIDKAPYETGQKKTDITRRHPIKFKGLIG